MSLAPKIIHIDLTSETEHCAVCTNVLEQGCGKASRVYVLKDCRCVSLTTTIPCYNINRNKVICGHCLRFPGNPPFLPCKHADHVDLGWQRPLRLYNLKCPICLIVGSENAIRIALLCGAFLSYIRVLANSLGHVYCQDCILLWTEFHSNPLEDTVTCPSCKNRRTRTWRLLAREHIVVPVQRGVEIASLYNNP